MNNTRRWRWIAGSVAIFVAVGGGAVWLRERSKSMENSSSAAPHAAVAGTHAMPMGNASALDQPTGDFEFSVPSEQLERIQLKFARVTRSQVRQDLRVPGTIQPDAYREVRVNALAGGIVTQVPVEIGQEVKRGQTLGRIFSRELAEAQTALKTFNAEFEAEHKKLERTQELVRLGAASREELEAVQANHNVHAAHVEEARQKLRFLGLGDAQIARIDAGEAIGSDIAIEAPMNGIILARTVNPGQVVMAAQELFTVTDLSSVWAEGNVLENDFGKVRVGAQASVQAAAYPGQVFHGTVSYIDPRVDPQTRTAKVRVELKNSESRLRLGLYVEMLFASVSARVLSVPKAAVQSIGSDYVVYVPGADNGRFMQRLVRVGQETDAGIEVTAGLESGQTVVTEGSALLRAEAARQKQQ